MDSASEKPQQKINIPAIHEVLLSIGIPPNLSGYQYIICAVGLTMRNPEYLYHITKRLYADIALRCNTTPVRVERAIRHAISTGWIHGDTDYINSVFMNCVNPEKGVPSNSLFLSRLYYYFHKSA